jgi:MFS family permease
VIPIVSLVTQGYALQLTRAAGRGQTTPPAFDRIGDLFVDGLKFLALMIVWYVLVIVAFVLAAFFGGLVSVSFGLLVGGLLVLGLSYALPAMITVLAVTDDFGAAFSGEYVAAWMGTGHYLAAFLVSIVLWLLLGIVVFLSLITIVGVIFAGAWATFVVAAFWGYQYRDAVAKGIVSPAPAETV